MSKTLVIVESPGKISKIGQILGPNYIVKASIGHIQDLDKTTLSIDVDNNFKPLYVTCSDKIKVVKELKSLAKDSTNIILATDGDREGEAIAYSLASVLKIENPKRIVFHEITKNAILKALEKPTTINYNMVYAQQARRILDRLVGYQISPLLWSYLDNSAKSAGRVQSVVVKIIIDKENEIEKSISEPYYKTQGEFMYNETKLNSVLQYNNKIYCFDNEENINEFLKNINKKTIFKVISVDNKKSIRKSSPPFITSSLQQEASTKLHFNVKKTMDVAQKLYEMGLITYMRSDCPNISDDAIKDIQKHIIEKYGKEYSDPKNYHSKNANSQDAHECIRPTHFDMEQPENLSDDQNKLYSLIWKRTIASQMSNANINIQTIQIDCINNKNSILIFNDKQTYFNTILENIEFPGYLIVYDNSIEDSEKNIGKIDIINNTILDFIKIKTSQEYTKPPLRFNEASLVKYLEKNGIGRPSTYASIISKIIDRNYVEIKNIDGVKKESKIIELDNKYKIKENIKDIIIGKESKKLIPTDMGNKVNNFMIKNFEPIMDIEFTANFESYLDKISLGNANWVKVLSIFYNMFHPIVDKLNNEKKNIKQNNDKFLGKDSNNLEIYCGTGKYGPYVKIQEINKNNNITWRYSKLTEPIDSITLDHAIELLKYPLRIGKIGNSIVTLNKGQYGPYLKCNDKNYSIDKSIDINSIDIDYAKQIINNPEITINDKYALKTFKIKDKILNVKNGKYGHYIEINNKSNKKFINIPKKYNIDNITIDDVLQIISDNKK